MSNDIIDNLKVVCQCSGIKKSTFKKLIANGVKTIEELRDATGAGSGSCEGSRCTQRLLEMLEEAGH